MGSQGRLVTLPAKGGFAEKVAFMVLFELLFQLQVRQREVRKGSEAAAFL